MCDFFSMSRQKSIDEVFKRRHFKREIIVLCVRWYLRHKLLSRDLVEMMVERGFAGMAYDHTALSSAQYAGVRQALEQIYQTGRHSLARR